MYLGNENIFNGTLSRSHSSLSWNDVRFQNHCKIWGKPLNLHITYVKLLKHHRRSPGLIMSSRALRKVQKERERLEAEQRQQDANSSEDEVALTAASKKSVFEMLGETEKRGGNEVEEDEDEEGEEYTLPQQELNK